MNREHSRAVAGYVAVALALGGAVACVVALDRSEFTWFLAVVTLAAVAANVADSRVGQPLFSVSGAFLSYTLAAGFLGGSAAFVAVVVAETGAWAIERYRPFSLLINVAGLGVPFLAAGEAFQAGVGGDPTRWQFYVGLAAMAGVALALNLLIVGTLSAARDSEPLLSRIPPGRAFVPALALNVVLTVAAASVYDEVGLGGLVFVLASIVAFSYMAYLVSTARDRARQYAALSWGVLSGLLRALDTRDPRAARHSAATAAFARDIARQCGMDARTCELAHTAGLLHDVGRLALADRVLDRGRTLGEEDWESIRRHPQLGAEMLQDLGVYGPVAEIVHAHHERLDGRGYPDGLTGDAIPELAKIVAVAEVYDTLTAEDTYRTQVSSFEALTELRRVSGSQLDGRYVEALAALLSGRGVEYRHASAADFERELDMERRVGDAATG